MSVQSMQDAVWALYYHTMGIHHNWCKYKKNPKAQKDPVPKDIMRRTKAIFEDLSEPELLKRCLHKGTQNANECFNHVIWSRIPKRTFVRYTTLQLGVYDAVITYNEGNACRLKVWHVDQICKQKSAHLHIKNNCFCRYWKT